MTGRQLRTSASACTNPSIPSAVPAFSGTSNLKLTNNLLLDFTAQSPVELLVNGHLVYGTDFVGAYGASASNYVDKFYSTQNYNGWTTTCATCKMQYIMSIAQKGTNTNSGSVYGPVKVTQSALYWYNPNGCGTGCGEFGESYWGSSLNLGCQNYPTWLNSDEEQECYNGPPSGALSKVVTVTGFVWDTGFNQSGINQNMTISTK